MFDFQEWKNDKRDELTNRLAKWSGEDELAEAMEQIHGFDASYLKLRELLVAKREYLPPVTLRDLSVEQLISDVDHFASMCEAKDNSFDESLM